MSRVEKDEIKRAELRVDFLGVFPIGSKKYRSRGLTKKIRTGKVISRKMTVKELTVKQSESVARIAQRKMENPFYTSNFR